MQMSSASETPVSPATGGAKHSIRRQMLAIGLISAAAVMAVGAGGLWQVAQFSTALDSLVTVSSGVRNHLEADMMHDALRGDVYRAFVAQSDEERAQVQAELAEHARILRCNRPILTSEELSRIRDLSQPGLTSRTAARWAAT